MKFATIVVCVFICVTATISSVDAVRGLFGLRSPPQLMWVNTTTGSQTSVATRGAVIPGISISQSLSTIDDKGLYYYTIGYNTTSGQSHALGISTMSGNLVWNIVLPFATDVAVGLGQAIDHDRITGNLIVTGLLTKGGTHNVGRVHIPTSTYKQVATVDGDDVFGAASVFNPDTSIEYLQLATTDPLYQSRIVNGVDIPAVMQPSSEPHVSIDLFAVDCNTGKVEHIIEDGFNGDALSTLQYDPKTKTLVGLGYKTNGATWQRTFERYDPVTKKWTTVRMITEFGIESGGNSALDVDGRVLYTIMQKRDAPQDDPYYLVGFNADTGEVVSSPYLCRGANDCPWQLEFAQYL